MKEEGLLTAIIWALIIGIVVVVITLIVTKPAPETFTELYFNNHELLPDFVNNESIDFSATIANHENENKEYNYTITKELFKIDYTCESPILYLEKNNNSYETNTNDPLLYIKEDNYSISFSYSMKSGENNIILSLEDIWDLELKNNILKVGGTITSFIEEPALAHNLRIDIQNGNASVFIDNKNIVNTTLKDYSHGFVKLQAIDTYAKIYNLRIVRNGQPQNVNLRFAQTNVNTNIELKQTLSQSIVLYQGPSDANSSEINTTSQNLKYLFEAEPFNLTRYTMQIEYRLLTGEEFSFGLTDNYQIKVDNNSFFETDESFDLNYTPGRGWHSIIIEVNDNIANVFFDYDYMLTANISNSTTNPFIKTDDVNLRLRNFIVESNLEPLAIRYSLPEEEEEQVDTARVYDSSLLNPTNETEEQEYESTFYEDNLVSWENYRVDIIYYDIDRNNSMFVVFKDLNDTMYSANLQPEVIDVNYLKNNTLQNNSINYSLSRSSQHRVIIDIEGKDIQMSVDGRSLLTDTLDKTTNGVLLLNHSNRVVLARMLLENKDEKETRTYTRRTTRTCDPKSINKTQTYSVLFVNDKEKGFINESISFNDDFDIAKIGIELNEEQEIHFVVKKK